MQLRKRNTDLAGLTEYLGLEPNERNRRSVYRQAWEGLIPHSKRGKFLIFDLDQIDRWLKANQRVSVQQALENAGVQPRR